ncbi:VWA domain-containing protein [bacterium]|nr:VWA domain-containing protein [bacterium]
MRTETKFAFIILIAALLYTPALRSQEYEVTVTNINVWVKVLDKSGKAVEGLTQKDIAVYEDDHEMQLTCFEEVQGFVEAAVPEVHESIEVQGAKPSVVTRRLVLFLDLYNTSPLEYKEILPQLQDFLGQMKDKNWEVMVATLTPKGKMGIVAPFTPDLDAISRTLERAPTNATRDQRITTARLDITRTLEQTLRGPNQVDPRTFDSSVRDAYRQAQNYAREERDVAEFSLSALESFGNELGKRENNDHITLLYVSGGFNADPGRQYFDLINRFVEWAGGAANPMEMNFRFPDSVRKFNFDLAKEIRDNVGRLNRNNITLYAMNTRGPVSPGEDNTRMNSILGQSDFGILQDYQDSMIQIAKETGGLSFQNSRNFKLGFDHVLNDLNHYYVVCFNAPEHKKKGEYHKIKVDVKVPDVKVRYRQGYVD